MPTTPRSRRLLAALRPRTVGELARAQWALLVAQAIVWTRPTGALIGEPLVVAQGAAADRPSPNAVAVRIARSVRRAAAYGVFRPRCLVRSVAIQRLLRAHGIPGGVIRIGVQRSDAGFAAHAWVELDGRVLGDDRADTARFTRLLDVQAS